MTSEQWTTFRQHDADAGEGMECDCATCDFVREWIQEFGRELKRQRAERN
jgi:hypothetical protein